MPKYFIGPTVDSMIDDKQRGMWPIILDQYYNSTFKTFYINLTYTLYQHLSMYNIINLDVDEEELYNINFHLGNIKFQFLDTAISLLYSNKQIAENLKKKYFIQQQEIVTKQSFTLLYGYVKNKISNSTISNNIWSIVYDNIKSLCSQLFNTDPIDFLKDKRIENNVRYWQAIAPLYWLWFHISCGKQIENANTIQNEIWSLFGMINFLIGCGDCRHHFEQLQPHLDTIYLKNFKNVANSLIEIHSIINERFISPEIMDKLKQEYILFWEN